MLPDETDLKNDYKGAGYDRGNNMPAEDNTCDVDGMNECFYYSNMTPQTHSLNAGIWKMLETYTRKIAKEDDSVLVWCGSVSFSGKTIGKVSIPDYCWKIIYIQKLDSTVAFSFKNNTEKAGLLENYKVSIDSIYHLSGFKFACGNKLKAQEEHKTIKLGETQEMSLIKISILDAGYKNITLIDQGQAGGFGNMHGGGNSWNKTTQNRLGITVLFENRNSQPSNIMIPITKVLYVDSTNKKYSIDENDVINAIKGKVLENATTVSTSWDKNGPAIVQEWHYSSGNPVLKLAVASRYDRLEIYQDKESESYTNIKANFGAEWEILLAGNSSFSFTLIFDAGKDSTPKELQWPGMLPFSLNAK